MKAKLLAAIIILILLTLTACGEPYAASPSVSAYPELEPCIDLEPTMYTSRDAFHNAVIAAKEATISGDALPGNVRASDKLEEILLYYDFENPVEEVALGEIRVTYAYVTLEYWNKEDDQMSAFVLQTWRKNISETEYNTETAYLDMLKKSNSAREIQINGQRVLKKEIYWQHLDNPYMGNQYWWIEDDYYIFMRVPPWLLELYPEETFFDIQVVNVPTEKAGDGLAE